MLVDILDHLITCLIISCGVWFGSMVISGRSLLSAIFPAGRIHSFTPKRRPIFELGSVVLYTSPKWSGWPFSGVWPIKVAMWLSLIIVANIIALEKVPLPIIT